MSDILTVRDHTQPCEHGTTRSHNYKLTWCPGGREIMFEQWGNWCWAHDREEVEHE